MLHKNILENVGVVVDYSRDIPDIATISFTTKIGDWKMSDDEYLNLVEEIRTLILQRLPHKSDF